MDLGDRSFLSDVMAEARRLGLAWWERLALLLVAAVLIVAGKRLWDALPAPRPGDVTLPTDVAPVDPPSEWGDSVKPEPPPDEWPKG